MAAFTSVQSGDWTDPATWGYGSPAASQPGNPSFETPDISSNSFAVFASGSSWTVTNSVYQIDAPSAFGAPTPLPDALAQCVALRSSNDGGPGTVSQSFSLGSGTYNLSWWMCRRSTGPSMRVKWNGTVVYSATVTNTGWQQFVVTGLTSTGTVSLEFSNQGSAADADLFLDYIQVLDQPTAYPDDSADDATVADGHTVVVDATTTIDDLTCSGTGSVTVAAGVTFTCDVVTVDNGVFQVGETGGGATLNFGSITVGGNGKTSARFRTRGLNGVITATANGNIVITDGVFDFGGSGTLNDVGDATTAAFDIGIVSATGNTHTFSGWLMDGCGRISFGNSLPGGMGVVFDGWRMVNTTHASQCVSTAGSSAGAGPKTLDASGFDKAVRVGLAFSAGGTAGCVFGAGIQYDGSGEAGEVAGSFLWAATALGGAHTLQGDYTDCYFFAQGTDNPHFPTPTNLGREGVVTGCLVEYGGAFSTDAGNAYYGEGAWALVNCIILPSGQDPATASGAVTAAGSATTKLRHCTLHSPQYSGGLLLGDGATITAAHPEVKSCLFWARLADADGLAAYAIDTTTANIITPANCVYNGLVNIQTPAYQGNYPTTQPGANDVRLDSTAETSVFLDPTRNLASWAVTKGSASGTYAGKVADAKAYLLADPTQVADLLAHVRGGFAPLNLSLKEAGHDGQDIGAVAGTWTAVQQVGLALLGVG